MVAGVELEKKKAGSTGEQDGSVYPLVTSDVGRRRGGRMVAGADGQEAPAGVDARHRVLCNYNTRQHPQ